MRLFVSVMMCLIGGGTSFVAVYEILERMAQAEVVHVEAARLQAFAAPALAAPRLDASRASLADLAWPGQRDAKVAPIKRRRPIDVEVAPEVDVSPKAAPIGIAEARPAPAPKAPVAIGSAASTRPVRGKSGPPLDTSTRSALGGPRR